MSKIEKSCSFPMWFKYSMSITQKLIPIYNITMLKNKSYVALNVAKVFVHKLKIPTCHKDDKNKIDNALSECGLKHY